MIFSIKDIVKDMTVDKKVSFRNLIVSSAHPQPLTPIIFVFVLEVFGNGVASLDAKRRTRLPSGLGLRHLHFPRLAIF